MTSFFTLLKEKKLVPSTTPQPIDYEIYALLCAATAAINQGCRKQILKMTKLIFLAFGREKKLSDPKIFTLQIS